MHLKGKMFLIVFLLSFSVPKNRFFAEEDLEALKKLMGDIISVQVEQKTTSAEAKNNIPPMQTDVWDFKTGARTLTVGYSRFLNQPPHFTGNYPSLTTGDMGVGFDGGSFHYWYRGNVIRVRINGADIMAAKPAKIAEANEGKEGRLRMIWEMEKNGELVLNFIIPESGQAIYSRIDIVPGNLSIKDIELRLTCYPGGFAPAHRLPSHRWIVTSDGEWDIPHGYTGTNPEVAIDKGIDWIFYADKLQSKGSLGLLLNAEEGFRGRVRIGSYAQSTEITYPQETRHIRLAFFAFETENHVSMKAFKAAIESERKILKNIH